MPDFAVDEEKSQPGKTELRRRLLADRRSLTVAAQAKATAELHHELLSLVRREHPASEIDVAQPELHQLRHTQAVAVEQVFARAGASRSFRHSLRRATCSSVSARWVCRTVWSCAERAALAIFGKALRSCFSAL